MSYMGYGPPWWGVGSPYFRMVFLSWGKGGVRIGAGIGFGLGEWVLEEKRNLGIGL